MQSRPPKNAAQPSRQGKSAPGPRSGPKGVNLGKASAAGPAVAATGKAVKRAAQASDSNVVTKRVLFERVKARAGKIRGDELRQAMDAVLFELGEALAAGEALKLPALGNVNVQRQKHVDGAEIVIVKLRRKKPAKTGKDPLAEPAAGG